MFSPLDRMMLAFIAVMAAVSVLAHPEPAHFLVLLAIMAAAFVAAAWWGQHSELGRVAHAFLPLPIVVTIFNVAGPLIGVANPLRFDDTMARLDLQWFGPFVPAWKNLLGRPNWLTDGASLFYVSYYFIPFGMCIALWVQRRWKDFDDLAFALITTLLLTYVGYFLVPTTGPRVPHEHELQVLGGGTFSARVRDFLRAAEVNQLDAFPSGHTALSLVYLGYGWRLFPSWKIRIPLAVSVVGIVFATVYLSLHYAVDLIAGALLALSIPWAVRGLHAIFGQGGTAQDHPVRS
ncbi:MAG TPA: phosphatase PAP2 family protein [Anaeromyxobacteraceae bacterium]|nr:phosphatase PAP2 family protein [Anaeromyxobacteraceae bacterium]